MSQGYPQPSLRFVPKGGSYTSYVSDVSSSSGGAGGGGSDVPSSATRATCTHLHSLPVGYYHAPGFSSQLPGILRDNKASGSASAAGVTPPVPATVTQRLTPSVAALATSLLSASRAGPADTASVDADNVGAAFATVTVPGTPAAACLAHAPPAPGSAAVAAALHNPWVPLPPTLAAAVTASTATSASAADGGAFPIGPDASPLQPSPSGGGGGVGGVARPRNAPPAVPVTASAHGVVFAPLAAALSALSSCSSAAATESSDSAGVSDGAVCVGASLRYHRLATPQSYLFTDAALALPRDATAVYTASLPSINISTSAASSASGGASARASAAVATSLSAGQLPTRLSLSVAHVVSAAHGYALLYSSFTAAAASAASALATSSSDWALLMVTDRTRASLRSTAAGFEDELLSVLRTRLTAQHQLARFSAKHRHAAERLNATAREHKLVCADTDALRQRYELARDAADSLAAGLQLRRGARNAAAELRVAAQRLEQARERSAMWRRELTAVEKQVDEASALVLLLEQRLQQRRHVRLQQQQQKIQRQQQHQLQVPTARGFRALSDVAEHDNEDDDDDDDDPDEDGGDYVSDGAAAGGSEHKGGSHAAAPVSGSSNDAYLVHIPRKQTSALALAGFPSLAPLFPSQPAHRGDALPSLRQARAALLALRPQRETILARLNKNEGAVQGLAATVSALQLHPEEAAGRLAYLSHRLLPDAAAKLLECAARIQWLRNNIDRGAAAVADAARRRRGLFSVLDAISVRVAGMSRLHVSAALTAGMRNEVKVAALRRMQAATMAARAACERAALLWKKTREAAVVLYDAVAGCYNEALLETGHAALVAAGGAALGAGDGTGPADADNPAGGNSAVWATGAGVRRWIEAAGLTVTHGSHGGASGDGADGANVSPLTALLSEPYAGARLLTSAELSRRFARHFPSATTLSASLAPKMSTASGAAAGVSGAGGAVAGPGGVGMSASADASTVEVDQAALALAALAHLCRYRDAHGRPLLPLPVQAIAVTPATGREARPLGVVELELDLDRAADSTTATAKTATVTTVPLLSHAITPGTPEEAYVQALSSSKYLGATAHSAAAAAVDGISFSAALTLPPVLSSSTPSALPLPLPLPFSLQAAALAHYPVAQQWLYRRNDVTTLHAFVTPPDLSARAGSGSGDNNGKGDDYGDLPAANVGAPALAPNNTPNSESSSSDNNANSGDNADAASGADAAAAETPPAAPVTTLSGLGLGLGGDGQGYSVTVVSVLTSHTFTLMGEDLRVTLTHDPTARGAAGPHPDSQHADAQAHGAGAAAETGAAHDGSNSAVVAVTPSSAQRAAGVTITVSSSSSSAATGAAGDGMLALPPPQSHSQHSPLAPTASAPALVSPLASSAAGSAASGAVAGSGDVASAPIPSPSAGAVAPSGNVSRATLMASDIDSSGLGGLQSKLLYRDDIVPADDDSDGADDDTDTKTDVDVDFDADADADPEAEASADADADTVADVKQESARPAATVPVKETSSKKKGLTVSFALASDAESVTSQQSSASNNSGVSNSTPVDKDGDGRGGLASPEPSPTAAQQAQATDTSAFEYLVFPPSNAHAHSPTANVTNAPPRQKAACVFPSVAPNSLPPAPAPVPPLPLHAHGCAPSLTPRAPPLLTVALHDIVAVEWVEDPVYVRPDGTQCTCFTEFVVLPSGAVARRQRLDAEWRPQRFLDAIRRAQPFPDPGASAASSATASGPAASAARRARGRELAVAATAALESCFDAPPDPTMPAHTSPATAVTSVAGSGVVAAAGDAPATVEPRDSLNHIALAKRAVAKHAVEDGVALAAALAVTKADAAAAAAAAASAVAASASLVISSPNLVITGASDNNALQLHAPSASATPSAFSSDDASSAGGALVVPLLLPMSSHGGDTTQRHQQQPRARAELPKMTPLTAARADWPQGMSPMFSPSSAHMTPQSAFDASMTSPSGSAGDKQGGGAAVMPAFALTTLPSGAPAIASTGSHSHVHSHTHAHAHGHGHGHHGRSHAAKTDVPEPRVPSAAELAAALPDVIAHSRGHALSSFVSSLPVLAAADALPPGAVVVAMCEGAACGRLHFDPATANLPLLRAGGLLAPEATGATAGTANSAAAAAASAGAGVLGVQMSVLPSASATGGAGAVCATEVLPVISALQRIDASLNRSPRNSSSSSSSGSSTGRRSSATGPLPAPGQLGYLPSSSADATGAALPRRARLYLHLRPGYANVADRVAAVLGGALLPTGARGDDAVGSAADVAARATVGNGMTHEAVVRWRHWCEQFRPGRSTPALLVAPPALLAECALGSSNHKTAAGVDYVNVARSGPGMCAGSSLRARGDEDAPVISLFGDVRSIHYLFTSLKAALTHAMLSPQSLTPVPLCADYGGRRTTAAAPLWSPRPAADAGAELEDARLNIALPPRLSPHPYADPVGAPLPRVGSRHSAAAAAGAAHGFFSLHHLLDLHQAASGTAGGLATGTAADTEALFDPAAAGDVANGMFAKMSLFLPSASDHASPADAAAAAERAANALQARFGVFAGTALAAAALRSGAYGVPPRTAAGHCGTVAGGDLGYGRERPPPPPLVAPLAWIHDALSPAPLAGAFEAAPGLDPALTVAGVPVYWSEPASKPHAKGAKAAAKRSIAAVHRVSLPTMLPPNAAPAVVMAPTAAAAARAGPFAGDLKRHALSRKSARELATAGSAAAYAAAAAAASAAAAGVNTDYGVEAAARAGVVMAPVAAHPLRLLATLAYASASCARYSKDAGGCLVAPVYGTTAQPDAGTSTAFTGHSAAFADAWVASIAAAAAAAGRSDQPALSRAQRALLLALARVLLPARVIRRRRYARSSSSSSCARSHSSPGSKKSVNAAAGVLALPAPAPYALDISIGVASGAASAAPLLAVLAPALHKLYTAAVTSLARRSGRVAAKPEKSADSSDDDEDDGVESDDDDNDYDCDPECAHKECKQQDTGLTNDEIAHACALYTAIVADHGNNGVHAVADETSGRTRRRADVLTLPHSVKPRVGAETSLHALAQWYLPLPRPATHPLSVAALALALAPSVLLLLPPTAPGGLLHAAQQQPRRGRRMSLMSMFSPSAASPASAAVPAGAASGVPGGGVPLSPAAYMTSASGAAAAGAGGSGGEGAHVSLFDRGGGDDGAGVNTDGLHAWWSQYPVPTAAGGRDNASVATAAALAAAHTAVVVAGVASLPCSGADTAPLSASATDGTHDGSGVFDASSAAGSTPLLMLMLNSLGAHSLPRAAFPALAASASAVSERRLVATGSNPASFSDSDSYALVPSSSGVSAASSIASAAAAAAAAPDAVLAQSLRPPALVAAAAAAFVGHLHAAAAPADSAHSAHSAHSAQGAGGGGLGALLAVSVHSAVSLPLLWLPRATLLAHSGGAHSHTAAGVPAPIAPAAVAAAAGVLQTRSLLPVSAPLLPAAVAAYAASAAAAASARSAMITGWRSFSTGPSAGAGTGAGHLFDMLRPSRSMLALSAIDSPEPRLSVRDDDAHGVSSNAPQPQSSQLLSPSSGVVAAVGAAISVLAAAAAGAVSSAAPVLEASARGALWGGVALLRCIRPLDPPTPLVPALASIASSSSGATAATNSKAHTAALGVNSNSNGLGSSGSGGNGAAAPSVTGRLVAAAAAAAAAGKPDLSFKTGVLTLRGDLPLLGLTGLTPAAAASALGPENARAVAASTAAAATAAAVAGAGTVSSSSAAVAATGSAGAGGGAGGSGNGGGSGASAGSEDDGGVAIIRTGGALGFVVGVSTATQHQQQRAPAAWDKGTAPHTAPHAVPHVVALVTGVTVDGHPNASFPGTFATATPDGGAAAHGHTAAGSDGAAASSSDSGGDGDGWALRVSSLRHRQVAPVAFAEGVVRQRLGALKRDAAAVAAARREREQRKEQQRRERDRERELQRERETERAQQRGRQRQQKQPQSHLQPPPSQQQQQQVAVAGATPLSTASAASSVAGGDAQKQVSPQSAASQQQQQQQQEMSAASPGGAAAAVSPKGGSAASGSAVTGAAKPASGSGDSKDAALAAAAQAAKSYLAARTGAAGGDSDGDSDGEGDAATGARGGDHLFRGVVHSTAHVALRGASRILPADSLKTLVRQMPKGARVRPWGCVFDVATHGGSLVKFYEHAAAQAPDASLVVARDALGRVFGGFCSKKWVRGAGAVGTGECFVFQFDPALVLYRWSGETRFYANAGFEGISFGGGGDEALFFDKQLAEGKSGRSKTFNNDCLSTEPLFKVAAFELWAQLPLQ